MLGWRMEEEAKLEFTITVNWRREDGSIATTLLATLARGACRSAEDVGLQLSDAKPILGRLQEIVVSEQLQRSFNSADQRVRAERHPEPAHQALAGTSSQGATHHSDNLIGSLGLSCVRGANL
jgi:hypothetical protein